MNKTRESTDNRMLTMKSIFSFSITLEINRLIAYSRLCVCVSSAATKSCIATSKALFFGRNWSSARSSADDLNDDTDIEPDSIISCRGGEKGRDCGQWCRVTNDLGLGCTEKEDNKWRTREWAADGHTNTSILWLIANKTISSYRMLLLSGDNRSTKQYTPTHIYDATIV